MEKLLEFFEYAHLPKHLQRVSKPFHQLAHQLHDELLVGDPESTVAMRKLLEAKDAAVRSAMRNAEIAPG